MSTYRIENEDGHLALVSDTQLEWLDDIEVVSFPSESVVCVRVTLCDSEESNLQAGDVEGTDDIRTEMTEWLEDNGYSVSIPCDFGNPRSIDAAFAEATAIRDRFLSGDYIPLTARYKVTWISKDQQGHFEMGEHVTLEAAVSSLPDATAELLGQCGGGRDGDQQRAGILAGRLWVEARWETDTDFFVGEIQTFDVADFAPLPAAA